ncbi:MAG: SDR family NAD(P)-dependent oxidoreductase, partial [Candidatus Nanopelagicales bacterium]
MTTRELDVVVFGASGFVGRLTAEHLAAAAPDGTRIGLAGRSLERLEEVRSALGADAAAWTLIEADVDDRASIEAMAARTRVLATTV